MNNYKSGKISHCALPSTKRSQKEHLSLRKFTAPLQLRRHAFLCLLKKALRGLKVPSVHSLFSNLYYRRCVFSQLRLRLRGVSQQNWEQNSLADLSVWKFVPNWPHVRKKDPKNPILKSKKGNYFALDSCYSAISEKNSYFPPFLEHQYLIFEADNSV